MTQFKCCKQFAAAQTGFSFCGFLVSKRLERLLGGSYSKQIVQLNSIQICASFKVDKTRKFQGVLGLAQGDVEVFHSY